MFVAAALLLTRPASPPNRTFDLGFAEGGCEFEAKMHLTLLLCNYAISLGLV